MVKKAAVWLGVVLLAVGVLGYVPALTPNGNLLGIFQVDGTHNLIHVLSGVVAILAGMGSGNYAKLYFQVFGVVYGLVAILGFMNSSVLGLITVNMADNLLHVVIAALSLYLGFGKSDHSMPMAKPQMPKM